MRRNGGLRRLSIWEQERKAGNPHLEDPESWFGAEIFAKIVLAPASEDVVIY